MFDFCELSFIEIEIKQGENTFFLFFVYVLFYFVLFLFFPKNSLKVSEWTVYKRKEWEWEEEEEKAQIKKMKKLFKYFVCFYFSWAFFLFYVFLRNVSSSEIY